MRRLVLASLAFACLEALRANVLAAPLDLSKLLSKQRLSKAFESLDLCGFDLDGRGGDVGNNPRAEGAQAGADLGGSRRELSANEYQGAAQQWRGAGSADRSGSQPRIHRRPGDSPSRYSGDDRLGAADWGGAPHHVDKNGVDWQGYGWDQSYRGSGDVGYEGRSSVPNAGRDGSRWSGQGVGGGGSFSHSDRGAGSAGGLDGPSLGR